ncbi:MAG: glutathione-disulfide reductase [Hyphomicrobiaceae bacterium]
MSKFDYDLFVIGGGSGGVRAARIAAGHGAKVALAEEYRLGGTCVIRGCVPKKLLVYASRFRDEFEDAVGFGWSVPEPTFDWPTLIAAKDAEIERLEGLYRNGLERSGVAILKARAELVDAHTVTVQPGNRRITARIILVATGGRPVVPQVEGAGHAITSNEAFHLESLPKSILIAGGGYIAVEFACIFSGLGVDTTLLYRGPKILRGFDEELRDGLTEALFKRRIDVVCNAEIASIDKAWSSYKVTLKDGTTVATGRVMFATGRAPNTHGLGLEAAGVKVGEKGQIAVDAASRTSAENIYAVGDVTDRVNLTPVAIREGHMFADNVFGGKAVTFDHGLVPTAVFSTPEIGTVGLTEAAARARYPKLDVYKAGFKPLKHTLSGRDERMLLKLLVDGDSGRVVGCHILGADAAEIVQMAAIAMRMGATKADFDATVALHPSAAEELVTMREKWAPPAKPAAAGRPKKRVSDAAS